MRWASSYCRRQARREFNKWWNATFPKKKSASYSASAPKNTASINSRAVTAAKAKPTVRKCPVCDTHLAPDAEACPKCLYVFSRMKLSDLYKQSDSSERMPNTVGGGGKDMALIKCPECGREVSDAAHACPHCGYPIYREKLWRESDERLKKTASDFLKKYQGTDIYDKIVSPEYSSLGLSSSGLGLLQIELEIKRVRIELDTAEMRGLKSAEKKRAQYERLKEKHRKMLTNLSSSQRFNISSE